MFYFFFSTFEILVKAARFSKPSPYLKPKYFIFQHSICLFLRCQNVNQIKGKTNARLLLLVKMKLVTTLPDTRLSVLEKCPTYRGNMTSVKT